MIDLEVVYQLVADLSFADPRPQQTSHEDGWKCTLGKSKKQALLDTVKLIPKI